MGKLASSSIVRITVAIPTFDRDEVLRETLGYLFELKRRASEVLVLDQTLRHDDITYRHLARWHENGLIRWHRLPYPSVVGAMNRALLLAAGEIVLFLDDDIVPAEGLFDAHLRNYGDPKVWAVSGQVLQPGEEKLEEEQKYTKRGFGAFLDFPFNSTRAAEIKNVMAGNLSLRKKKALNIGGFDENFIGVAYRFETEFCRRMCEAGGKILFEPDASIRHLRAQRGGTRSIGNHLTSVSPMHGVGDYYFALKQGLSMESLSYIFNRPVREVCTRFHMKHPWWIPMKLLGEIRAFCLAIRLFRSGPKYISGITNPST